MSSNRQMMKDAMTSGETLTGVGKGGLLSPEQARRFISYMTDNTALLNDTRLEQMAAPEKQLDFLLIGSRLIRKATEATSPAELAAANTSRKELRSIAGSCNYEGLILRKGETIKLEASRAEQLTKSGLFERS